MDIIEYKSYYTFRCDCNVDIKLERYELSAYYDMELDLYLITCPRCGRTIVVGVDELDKFYSLNAIVIKDLKSIDIELIYDEELKQIIQKYKNVKCKD